MAWLLDVAKAAEHGHDISLAGKFRGERAVIVRTDDNGVTVKLPHSTEPDKEITVCRACLTSDKDDE